MVKMTTTRIVPITGLSGNHGVSALFPSYIPTNVVVSNNEIVKFHRIIFNKGERLDLDGSSFVHNGITYSIMVKENKLYLGVVVCFELTPGTKANIDNIYVSITRTSQQPWSKSK
jgi:hypothetical protein